MRYIKLALFIFFILSAGCANLTGSSSTDSTTPTIQTSFYYDFHDIRVPEEMEIQQNKSSITPVEGGKAGVMKFKGRAEPISLFDFFYNSMPKDGWILQSYQKYQRFLLVFAKENNVCVITIDEDPFYYTWLEVWVSPKVQSSVGTQYPYGGQPANSYSGSGSSFDYERDLSQ